jgi:hypothetical protein
MFTLKNVTKGRAEIFGDGGAMLGFVERKENGWIAFGRIGGRITDRPRKSRSLALNEILSFHGLAHKNLNEEAAP